VGSRSWKRQKAAASCERLRLNVCAIAFSALVAGSTLAAAQGANRTISANLDSDHALERVVPRRVCESADGALTVPPCSDEQFPRRRVEVEDACDGKPYTFAISSVQDFVDRLRVTNADGRTKRPEIFFDIRSGATGRGGEARVVRIANDRPVGPCPRTKVLFRYPSKSTLGRIPRGAAGRDSWSPVLRDLTHRYRGKEIRLVETYVDRNDAFCCPSFERLSYFRFARARDKYVRYRTRVRRIKR
jgi:hypothetical protein